MRVYIEHQTTYSRIELLARFFFGAFYIYIPHMIAFGLFLIYVVITQIIGWFSILFTTKYPRFAFNAFLGTLNWQLRLSATALNLVDGYPAFGPSVNKNSKVFFEIDYPEHVTRKRLLFSSFIAGLTVIPHFIVLSFRNLVSYFINVIAFFAILITGKYPSSLHKFNVGTMQLGYRISSYMSYMYFRYPEFSTDVTEIDNLHNVQNSKE